MTHLCETKARWVNNKVPLNCLKYYWVFVLFVCFCFYLCHHLWLITQPRNMNFHINQKWQRWSSMICLAFWGSVFMFQFHKYAGSHIYIYISYHQAIAARCSIINLYLPLMIMEFCVPYGFALSVVCIYSWHSRCRCNMVNFFHNPHNRHPIARPWGRDMGCRLCF